MAHLRDIYLPKCRSCGKTATVELWGSRNERLQPYCKPCGKRALVTRNLYENLPSFNRTQPTKGAK
jgi:transposase-like protein